MRICRVCKGMPDPVGYCPKCNKVRTKYEQIEPRDVATMLYALYVDYVRKFHEQDAPTMLLYKEFYATEFRNTEFMERLLTMYGLHHKLKEYYSVL